MTCTLELSEDQRQIVDTAGAMLGSHYPVTRLRERPQSDALGPIADFGGFALALPEALDGTGFSVLEEAMLHELLGRHLVTTAALATPLAARLVAASGDEEKARALAAGDTIACAGLLHDGDVLLVEPDDTSLAVVFDDRTLHLAEFGTGQPEPLTAMGHGRPLARLPQSACQILCRETDTGTVRLADLLVSAQLIGIAGACRDLAVDYAQTREQFGRPIGMFQAIKHICADMAIGVERLSALRDFAAIAERDGAEDAAFQIAALRRLAPDVALDNARKAIQVHGGIGFSAEADVHHFLKQAHILSRLGRAGDLMALTAPLTPTERN